MSVQLLRFADLTSTIGLGLICLAYILADPDERPSWIHDLLKR